MSLVYYSVVELLSATEDYCGASYLLSTLRYFLQLLFNRELSLWLNMIINLSIKMQIFCKLLSEIHNCGFEFFLKSQGEDCVILLFIYDWDLNLFYLIFSLKYYMSCTVVRIHVLYYFNREYIEIPFMD